ncbi:hypothetical protein [Pedobacter sp. GR22-6]|uniref:hypothetical protein n=1 Tax=Pedobacter sp. GR22-6 TaxID=3127957 RepID=UPI00307E937B
MKNKKQNPTHNDLLLAEPEMIFEIQNSNTDGPIEEDPTTTLATKTFTHLITIR